MKTQAHDDQPVTIKIDKWGRRALKRLSVSWECTMAAALRRLVRENKPVLKQLNDIDKVVGKR